MSSVTSSLLQDKFSHKSTQQTLEVIEQNDFSNNQFHFLYSELKADLKMERGIHDEAEKVEKTEKKTCSRKRQKPEAKRSRERQLK